MSTILIYNYDKFRPAFDSIALMLADTSLSYSETGNKYRVDVDDLVTAGKLIYKVAASGASDQDETTAGGVKLYLVGGQEAIIIACSDETTAITTGTAKRTFRMPFAMTVTNVVGSLVTAQTSGNVVTVDVNEGGTSILSTKLTFDNGEKTTTTAATPVVVSDAALAADAEITIDVDQIGDGTAAGLKVTLLGYQ